MGEAATEFQNSCPYMLTESEIEEEADQCIYDTLEKLYIQTVYDLEKSPADQFFTSQYKLMFEEMEKFYKKNTTLRESNRYLQSELDSTIAELQAMQKLSAIDKETIDQLKDEMERRWENALGEQVYNKLCEQVNMLSALLNQKDEVIAEQQHVLDTLSKMRDSVNEEKEQLLHQIDDLTHKLATITQEKQNIEELNLQAQQTHKQLLENLQTIDAHLMTERNEKELLSAQVQEYLKLQTSPANDDHYQQLCAEFEKANSDISDLTEQTHAKQEEIERLKEALDKAACDVKLMEQTVVTLQETNAQLTRERKELATMLQQCEKKKKSKPVEGGHAIYEPFIQEEQTDNVDSLSEQCIRRNLSSKESQRHLKRYSGTLRDVIQGLEQHLAQL